ncbi:hypothetical protein [Criibacterium bergeronii]|nr:hypothetical protein [Criibacterium bergeronii]
MKEKKTKMGRPTDNPKETRITVRLDEESRDILEKYSKKNSISKNETVRLGIKKLKDNM